MMYIIYRLYIYMYSSIYSARNVSHVAKNLSAESA